MTLSIDKPTLALLQMGSRPENWISLPQTNVSEAHKTVTASATISDIVHEEYTAITTDKDPS